jgi:hypothetical protein
VNFQDCKPYLLTPKLGRSRRYRSTFIFGGTGFMIFLFVVWAMLAVSVLMLAMMWDMCVLTVFGIAVVVDAVAQKVRPGALRTAPRDSLFAWAGRKLSHRGRSAQVPAAEE